MKIRFMRYAPSSGLNDLIRGIKEQVRCDIKKLHVSNSRYRGYPKHLIINWGSTSRQKVKIELPILNEPRHVEIASDKVQSLRVLTESLSPHYVPTWVLEMRDARRIISDRGEEVYCRTLSRASQGRGIVLATHPSEVVPAPLYTVKIDISRELRVHVFKEEVIDYAQKKRIGRARREEEGIELNEDIRNHSNGWIFAREGVTIDPETKSTAIKAVNALGLDFGAVDIAITPQDIPKVLEVNSAPGLEGTTLESYTNAFVNHIKEIRRARGTRGTRGTLEEVPENRRRDAYLF